MRDSTPLALSTTTVPQSEKQTAKCVTAQVLHREDSSPIRGFSQLHPKANNKGKKTHLYPQEISGSVCDRDQKMGSLTAARFPTNSDQDLQIDSYSGANFQHAQAKHSLTPKWRRWCWHLGQIVGHKEQKKPLLNSYSQQ